jgi:hypothetical protein
MLTKVLLHAVDTGVHQGSVLILGFVAEMPMVYLTSTVAGGSGPKLMGVGSRESGRKSGPSRCRQLGIGTSLSREQRQLGTAEGVVVSREIFL